MGLTTDLDAAALETVERADGVTVIHLKGRLHILDAGRMLRRLRRLAGKSTVTGLSVDLSRITQMNDTALLLLFELRSMPKAGVILLRFLTPGQKARPLLSMAGFDDPKTASFSHGKSKSNLLVRLGDATITEAYNLRFMISFVGSVAISFFRILVRPQIPSTGRYHCLHGKNRRQRPAHRRPHQLSARTGDGVHVVPAAQTVRRQHLRGLPGLHRHGVGVGPHHDRHRCGRPVRFGHSPPRSAP